MSLYLRMAALFFVLTGLLMLIGYAVGLYLGDPLTFMLIGLVMAGVLNFVSYYFSDTIVVKMSRARIIQESDNPTLYGTVARVAQLSNIPMPRVGIVDSPQPNAFATGRGPQKAVVVATSSILQTLNPKELEAVIGHEIGHVIHRDVLISSVAATIAGVISYIGTMAMWSMMMGAGGQRGRNNSSALLLLVAAILVPLGATFVQLGISRSNEYNADEYGAKLTQNPAGLASALQKISTRAKAQPMNNPAKSPSPSTASLWIVNPFSGQSLVELFSTHPSLQNRVTRLRRIGQEIGVYVP
jgi:heat shock protein HtpX